MDHNVPTKQRDTIARPHIQIADNTLTKKAPCQENNLELIMISKIFGKEYCMSNSS